MLDSELNPEAPEFHPLPDPEMTTTVEVGIHDAAKWTTSKWINPNGCLPFLQPTDDRSMEDIHGYEEGYKHVKKATQAANTFPIGNAHSLFQTFTDFNSIISRLRKNVICQSTQIMFMDLPTGTLRCEDNESHMEQVRDHTDDLLDRVHVHINKKKEEERPPGAGGGGGGAAGAGKLAAWNRSPVVATIQTKGGSASLLGAKNIPRPQLAFKEPVDNSHKLFVPRLHDKPHGIKPLALTILYDDAGQPVGYSHPYETELKLYSPPAWALQESSPPAPPPPLEGTRCTLVETAPQLDALLRHLNSVTEIAIDLEHHSYRTYQGFTCLLQISTDEGGDFIVDALALRDCLHALNHPFTDPNKIKVFHGAEHDIQWLQRDFGVYVVGLFDTHQAARLLRHEGLALKHLLAKYCGFQADKTYQLADWRMRPLPDELVRYARADTHYLLHVWRRMRRELLAHPAGELLHAAFRKSAEVAAMTYVKPVVRPESHEWLHRKAGVRLGRAQAAALRALWAWRDEHARELDESPAYLLPNHLLLALAGALPRDLQAVRALADPVPPFLNHNLDALHRIILACREIPEEPQVLTMPASVRSMAAPLAPHPLCCAHDLAPASHSSDESEGESGAGPLAPPDLCAFSAPWLTPPASPEPAPAPAPTAQKSRLNANAATFVPPYDRYKMYRIISQVEEVKTLKEKEARVAALGKGSQVIRETVLAELPRTRELPPPAPAPPSPRRAHDAAEPRKRKINEKLDPKTAHTTAQNKKQPKIN